MRLVIPGKLHSLNEYISACRRNPHVGAKMKKDDQTQVEWFIRSQLRGVRFKTPVRMDYTWFEKNKKRDLDNVSSYGRKVIQDALVHCGVITDDSWKQVTGFSDRFYVDRLEPRIEVEIVENEAVTM